MANKTYNDHPTDNTPAADDLIPYWDVASSAARKATRAKIVGATITGDGTIDTGGETLTVPATGTAALRDATNTFTARQQFSVGIGLLGQKLSFPHNSATPLCKIASSGVGVMAGAFLIGMAVSGGTNSSGQMWVLTQGYNQATMTKLSEALFGHSSIAITAAANTGTREITLTMTQINSTSATQTVRVSVVPILYGTDPTITLTML